jgi:hypothetical protein
MSQTKQQGADPGKPAARKDWELFWRIIAGLMLAVIVWVLWVVYQIMPRSVVTPLAYSSAPIRPIGLLHPESGLSAIAPTAAVEPSGPQSVSIPATTEPAQTATADANEGTGKGDGLRLATEISAPPTEKRRIPVTLEGKSEAAAAVPAATGVRP